MTWQRWELRSSFLTPDGRPVWMFYAPGANGDRYSGGTVRVFDRNVALEDLDYARYFGQLFWTHSKAIEYVSVDEGWQLQGVATMMWALAREVEPELRHSTTHRSADGESWIRAVSPEERLLHGALDAPNAEPSAAIWKALVRRLLRRRRPRRESID